MSAPAESLGADSPTGPAADEMTVVTVAQYHQLTLQTALVLLPAQADRVAGFLLQMLERNRDPYLAQRVRPAIDALAAGDVAAARRFLERARHYLQHRPRR